MKRLNLLFTALIMVLGFSFATMVLAQDSTKTQTKTQTKTEAKSQVKTQQQDQNQVKASGATQTKLQDQNRLRIHTDQQNQEQVQNQNQIQHGPRFVDEDGDGFNDNAPDHDGDGIPNGLDPDYTGPQMRQGQGQKGFVDLDGDGINDNIMQQRRQGKGFSGKGARVTNQGSTTPAGPAQNQSGKGGDGNKDGGKK